MMAKRIFLAIIVVAGVALFWRFFVSSKTPAGQSPLVILSPSELAGAKTLFNAHKGETRIIALLSPT
jgi:hypothetical protein